MIFWVGVALDGFPETTRCVRMGTENGLTTNHDEDALTGDCGSSAQDMPQLLGVHYEVVRICWRDASGMRPAKGDD